MTVSLQSGYVGASYAGILLSSIRGLPLRGGSSRWRTPVYSSCCGTQVRRVGVEKDLLGLADQNRIDNLQAHSQAWKASYWLPRY